MRAQNLISDEMAETLIDCGILKPLYRMIKGEKTWIVSERYKRMILYGEQFKNWSYKHFPDSEYRVDELVVEIEDTPKYNTEQIKVCPLMSSYAEEAVRDDEKEGEEIKV